MKFESIKHCFVGLAVVTLLSACGSTPPASTTTAAPTPTVSSDSVATGDVDDTGLSGSDLDTSADIARIFYFDFDKSTLKPEAIEALHLHAQRLTANPVNVRLEGHADERGTREYNMALGERRANAVRDFLVLQGVDGSLLEVISYGEEKPEAMGSNESVWAKNRRVEIK